MTTVDSLDEDLAPRPTTRRERRATERIDWRRLIREGRVALGFALVGVVMWALSLSSISSAKPSQWGLLAAASPLLVIGIAVNTIGFAIAVRTSSVLAMWAAILVSILQLRFTPTVATEAPFYPWTYKHLAVADYIQNHGGAARDVDIYHHWTGLFGATAWFSSVTGVDSMTVAHWFTPVFYLLTAGLIYALARAWGLRAALATMVVFLVEALDWVGQGYYSPQSTALIFAYALLALVGLSRRRPFAPWLVLALFTAAVITHQLTPYWVLTVMGALWLMKALKPRWLLFACVAVAFGWLAFNMSSAQNYGLFSLGSNPVDNAQSNIHVEGAYGQELSSLIFRVLSLSIWLFAIGIVIVRLIRRRPVMAQAALAFGSFAILLGQSYGGEAIFRVFLYSLPGCAMLAAPVIERGMKARVPWMSLAAAYLAVMTVAAAHGIFGAWFAVNMSKEEVTEAIELARVAGVPAYITPAAPVWPQRVSDAYVDASRWTETYDQAMVYSTKLVHSHFASADDYQKFLALVASRGTTPTYLIITEQMRFYDWYYGILPLDALPNLQARMEADPHWTVYYRLPAIVIFKSKTTGSS